MKHKIQEYESGNDSRVCKHLQIYCNIRYTIYEHPVLFKHEIIITLKVRLLCSSKDRRPAPVSNTFIDMTWTNTDTLQYKHYNTLNIYSQ
jgi:hypothetical protein